MSQSGRTSPLAGDSAGANLSPVSTVTAAAAYVKGLLSPSRDGSQAASSSSSSSSSSAAPADPLAGGLAGLGGEDSGRASLAGESPLVHSRGDPAFSRDADEQVAVLLGARADVLRFSRPLCDALLAAARPDAPSALQSEAVRYLMAAMGDTLAPIQALSALAEVAAAMAADVAERDPARAGVSLSLAGSRALEAMQRFAPNRGAFPLHVAQPRSDEAVFRQAYVEGDYPLMRDAYTRLFAQSRLRFLPIDLRSLRAAGTLGSLAEAGLSFVDGRLVSPSRLERAEADRVKTAGKAFSQGLSPFYAPGAARRAPLSEHFLRHGVTLPASVVKVEAEKLRVIESVLRKAARYAELVAVLPRDVIEAFAEISHEISHSADDAAHAVHPAGMVVSLLAEEAWPDQANTVPTALLRAVMALSFDDWRAELSLASLAVRNAVFAAAGWAAEDVLPEGFTLHGEWFSSSEMKLLATAIRTRATAKREADSSAAVGKLARALTSAPRDSRGARGRGGTAVTASAVAGAQSTLRSRSHSRSRSRSPSRPRDSSGDGAGRGKGRGGGSFRSAGGDASSSDGAAGRGKGRGSRGRGGGGKGANKGAKLDGRSGGGGPRSPPPGSASSSDGAAISSHH